MRKFLKTVFFFALTVLILFMPLLITYIILDPFKVVMTYDTYYDPNANGWVNINKDYISTTTFKKNYKKENYDSFILGNSRSNFYMISDWEKYLPSNSNCFHFDANNESLYALHKKLVYIDGKGSDIKNVLLILDYATLVQDNPRSGHLFMISPELENNRNFIDFHLTCFRDFLTPKFLYTYIDFKISGVVKPYMKDGLMLLDKYHSSDTRSNESEFARNLEEMISQNKYYTTEILSSFYKRDTIVKYSPIAIKENQRVILYDIFKIFKKHKTNYKIIISPLYNQIKINQNDLRFLIILFGVNNVHDFSGINKFTKDYKNYYETSHYRIHVTKEILHEIYMKK